MAEKCFQCGLRENNYAGQYWKQGAPLFNTEPQCRNLVVTLITRGFNKEFVVDEQPVCETCRDSNIVRVFDQYISESAYKSLAESIYNSKDDEITDLKLDSDFDTWENDGKLCVTVSFRIGNRRCIFDYWNAGAPGYAMFRYADDSHSARKDALFFLRKWARAVMTEIWE